ncbi:MAG: hypothetical protein IKZ95_07115 [Lachnospiraceae bacterium]|nr:hypothetical protein [Lachnospiraceae bacterium]
MKILTKLALLGGAAFGGYYLYKKYVQKPDGEKAEDLSDAGFDFDDTAAKEESFADKVKAAAGRQLDRIK